MSFAFASVIAAALLFFCTVLWVPTTWAGFQPPELNSPVMDQAGVMKPAQARALGSLIRSTRERSGVQVSVLVVSGLDGDTIEEASMRTAEAWKLGSKKEGNGVLLLVAMAERKIRIEVGQGIEGELTDLESREIIDSDMVPLFRQGRPGDGIVAGVIRIVQKVAPAVAGDAALAKEVETMRPSRSKPVNSSFILALLGFVWFFMIIVIRRSRGSAFRRGGWSSGSTWSGGGGSWPGSSGGGGGWSGGGGGFSGGGSSGGW